MIPALAMQPTCVPHLPGPSLEGWCRTRRARVGHATPFSCTSCVTRGIAAIRAKRGVRQHCSWCGRFITLPAHTARGGMRTRLALTCSTAWPLRCSGAPAWRLGRAWKGRPQGHWVPERRKRSCPSECAMWRMYCVCLLSVIVVLDLLGQSHVNRTKCTTVLIYKQIEPQRAAVINPLAPCFSIDMCGTASISTIDLSAATQQ